MAVWLTVNAENSEHVEASLANVRLEESKSVALYPYQDKSVERMLNVCQYSIF